MILPESGHTVGTEGWVGRDDCQALNKRGCGDEAVEWVSMMERESCQGLDVARFEGSRWMSAAESLAWKIAANGAASVSLLSLTLIGGFAG
jgi:hypothetical protein